MSQILKWAGLGLLSVAGVTLASHAVAASRGQTTSGSSGGKGRPVPVPFAWDPKAGGPWLEGIDVSYLVDWPKAKASAGLSFAIAKATQGEPGNTGYGNTNSAFAKNRAGMIATLDFWGAYHWAIFSQDARKQAQALVKAIGAFDDKMLPPSVDAEWIYNDGLTPTGAPFPKTNAPQVIDFLYVFDEVIRNEMGRRPMIYSSAGWWNSIGDPIDPIQQAYAWWIAHWTSASHPSMPKGVAKYSLWQYSAEIGPLENIPILGTPQAGTKKPAVDRDRFSGNLEDMRAFVRASKV